jgi:hypothetical protein
LQVSKNNQLFNTFKKTKNDDDIKKYLKLLLTNMNYYETPPMHDDWPKDNYSANYYETPPMHDDWPKDNYSASMDPGIPLFIKVFISAVILGMVLIAGVIINSCLLSARQLSADNAQPVLTLPARVLTKRLHVSGRDHVSTSYHVTFETLADGVRQEYNVGSSEYGVHVEGDTGHLTHQGTRYTGFIREQPRVPVAIPVATDYECQLPIAVATAKVAEH